METIAPATPARVNVKPMPRPKIMKTKYVMAAAAKRLTTAITPSAR